MGAGEAGYRAGNPELQATSQSTKLRDFFAGLRSKL
jgi:hypothetical protein